MQPDRDAIGHAKCDAIIARMSMSCHLTKSNEILFPLDLTDVPHATAWIPTFSHPRLPSEVRAIASNNVKKEQAVAAYRDTEPKVFRSHPTRGPLALCRYFSVRAAWL